MTSIALDLVELALQTVSCGSIAARLCGRLDSKREYQATS
jgi:hypothetical protein